MRKPNPKGEPMDSMHSIEGYKIEQTEKQNDINVINSKHINMEEVQHDDIGTDN